MTQVDADSPAHASPGAPDLVCLQAVLDSSPDAGFLVDPDGRVLAAGRRVADLLWSPAATWVGSSAADLAHPDLRRAFERRLRAVASRPGSRAAGFPMTILRADRSSMAAKVWLSELTGSHLLMWLRAQDSPAAPALAPEIALAGDAVVQTIASAMYAHQRGDGGGVNDALKEAANAAQQVTTQLYEATTRRTRHARPRHDPATVAARETGDDPTGRAPGVSPFTGVVRVVVADDTATIRGQLRRILSGIPGVEVVGEARDGAEAVETALRLQPHLLLTDLSMPEKSGLEVIAEVRAAAPDMRLVALSGFSREKASIDALRHGATAYVEKGGAVSRFATLFDDLFPRRDRTPSAPSASGEDVAAPDGASVGALEVSVPQQREAQQADLVSVYAHELRSPITAQMMAIEMLMEDESLTEHHQQLLERARGNTVKMNRLVQTLCDANRVGAGNLNLVVAPVDFGHLVRGTCEGIEHVVEPERLDLQVDGIITVAVDKFRVQQVVENLVSNASKFGPDGAPIMVRVTQQGDFGAVEVSDLGTGIAPADRERLFDRFQRLGASQPGIGLGMYLSREIARAHGGDLAVVDGPTCGATFRLTLPTVA